MQDYEDIKKLILIAQSMGVRRLKVNDVEIVMAQSEPKLEAVDINALLDPTNKAPTEDEVRDWHVGGSGIRNSDGSEYTLPLVGEDDAKTPQ